MLLNFTFQEASPLITYSAGGWTEGSSSNDTESARYNGSFRVTQAAGASASLTFVGTAVSLFGATRPNHGNYNVTLDQQLQFSASGSSPDAFNKSLWHADNLGYTQHVVTLTNVPAGPNNIFLDLDFVSIERQLGLPNDNIFQLTLDDVSPLVNFTGSWSKSSGVSSAYQGTLHSTTTANSQVFLTFQGCCIEVYGQYANAPYTVALDNQPPLSMQGLDVDLAPNFQHPQTLLYLVDGLSEDSNHTVILTNSDSNVNRPFFLDYAVISSTHELNTTTNSTTPNSGGSSSTGSSTNLSDTSTSSPIGAIVGGIVGALVVVALLVALLVVRRRRRHRAEKSLSLDLIDEEPKPYILPTNAMFEGASHAHGQESFGDRTLPPLPPGASYSSPAPPSKSRPQVQPVSSYPMTEYTSSEGLLSPQAEAATASTGSSSSGGAGSTATSSSATRSGTLSSSSRSASTSRRNTKSRFSRSQRGAGSSQEVAVQEEDAGVILDPDEAPVSRTLPPAYNPEWHRYQSSDEL